MRIELKCCAELVRGHFPCAGDLPSWIDYRDHDADRSDHTNAHRQRGRPPKESGYVARKRVTYRLQPGLVQAIRRGARRRKISQTAYIELALQEWIKSDGIQMPPAR